MRHWITTTILIALFGLYGWKLAVRFRHFHFARAAIASSASATGNAVPSAAAASASASAATSAAGPAAPPHLLDRPLRVLAFGWDLAAPGVLENGGLDPAADSAFAARGVDVHIAITDATSTIENALARGGADSDGADVAIVPLPMVVASYERLRALTPAIFFVAGWSRGREGVASTRDVLVAPPPNGEVRVAGASDSAATFLALLALDMAGVEPARVHLGQPKTGEVHLWAVDRSADETPPGRLLFTSAEAARAIPFVAVAQHGFIEQHSPALVAWSREWLEGATKIGADAPEAARRITSARGAPEPLELLKRLGQTTNASLVDNARAAALSGRGAVTLERLFARDWRVLRATGGVATPAPEPAPIDIRIVAALARATPNATAAAATAEPVPDADHARVLLVHREGKLDEAAFIEALGFAAGVFEGAAIRVTIKSGATVDVARTKRIIGATEARYGVAGGRLVAGSKPIDKSSAAFEVLAR